MRAFKVFIFGLLYGWFLKIAFDRIYRQNEMEDRWNRARKPPYIGQERETEHQATEHDRQIDDADCRGQPRHAWVSGDVSRTETGGRPCEPREQQDL